jgi:hypothetical protein
MVHYDDVFLNINAKCNNNKYVRYKGMQSINQSSPPSPHTLRHKYDQQYGHYYYRKLLVANEARLQNAVKRYKQNSRPGTTITRYVHGQA